MKILCTFPGRHGDLLWTLPTVRAIAETAGEQVHFMTSAKYGRIAPLVKQQDYIANVYTDHSWQVQETAPITPLEPPTIPPGFDQVIHLAYPGWPEAPLPYYVEKIGRLQMPNMVPIELMRPWIKVDRSAAAHSYRVAGGFSDEHFELKYGIWSLLAGDRWVSLMGAKGSRWVTEGEHGECSWELAASILDHCKVFLGCCSSLHVLACAMGKPVLIMEPAEARWNPIFYPYGMDGPRVKIIRGGDGRPTFDARHVKDEIHALLQ